MKKRLPLFVLFLLLGFVSCDKSVQYGVYVRNTTGEPLEILYQSEIDTAGNTPKTIILPDKKSQFIIWTTEIPSEDYLPQTTQEDCSLVASYVKARTLSGSELNLEWCSNDVAFSRTDLGQAEFTLHYKEKHFN